MDHRPTSLTSAHNENRVSAARDGINVLVRFEQVFLSTQRLRNHGPYSPKSRRPNKEVVLFSLFSLVAGVDDGSCLRLAVDLGHRAVNELNIGSL
jgi:hypothetical protein